MRLVGGSSGVINQRFSIRTARRARPCGEGGWIFLLTDSNSVVATLMMEARLTLIVGVQEYRNDHAQVASKYRSDEKAGLPACRDESIIRSSMWQIRLDILPSQPDSNRQLNRSFKARKWLALKTVLNRRSTKLWRKRHLRP